VSGSDEQDAARRRRQRLIERLNAKEAELSGSRAERLQLSEKVLEAEIERERQRNFSRMGFPQIGPY
jgi:hypothetical protein